MGTERYTAQTDPTALTDRREGRFWRFTACERWRSGAAVKVALIPLYES